ncbi:MAG: rRNA maturation RNase YbeY [Bacteroidales bacterium]|nr:rRNA maturation RNase YbeY [Bacteroidales bacterium]
MSGKINFYYEDTDFEILNSIFVQKWLFDVLESKSYQPSKINYIFCSDVYLLKINLQFLNHDYYTDIITFPYSSNPKGLVSDIFVSIDRVRENATNFDHSFTDELHRVMVHGILHLIGFDDHADEDKTLMRKMEDYYLNLRPNSILN